MSEISVHNPNPGEVVYTEQGHSLPGHTTGKSTYGDKVTGRLLANGRLVLPAAPPASLLSPSPPRSKKANPDKSKEDTP